MKSEVENIDCMIRLREMPDKAFDLAIVDPPYGIGMDGGRIGNSEFARKDWDVVVDACYIVEICRVSVNQIIWGGNYLSECLPSTASWVYWDKRHVDMIVPKTYADGELAWTSFDIPLRIYRCLWDGIYKGVQETKIHPTQKPVALYKWLLTNYAKPGQTILDTHLGSGSSRIAAYDLGFDFTGYELDKDYFDAQEQRFANHIAQPKLFEPQAVEQQTMFAAA